MPDLKWVVERLEKLPNANLLRYYHFRYTPRDPGDPLQYVLVYIFCLFVFFLVLTFCILFSLMPPPPMSGCARTEIYRPYDGKVHYLYGVPSQHFVEQAEKELKSLNQVKFRLYYGFLFSLMVFNYIFYRAYSRTVMTNGHMLYPFLWSIAKCVPG